MYEFICKSFVHLRYQATYNDPNEQRALWLASHFGVPNYCPNEVQAEYLFY